MRDECSTGSDAQANDEEIVLHPDLVEQHRYTKAYDELLFDEDLTALAKVTYQLLLAHGRGGRGIFPGMKRLCTLAQVSENTLRAALNQLQARGLVRRRRRGDGQTNCYQLYPAWSPSPSASDPRPSRTSDSEVPDPQILRIKKVEEVEVDRPLFASLTESALIEERRCLSTDYRSLFGAFCSAIGRQPQGSVERARWGKGVKALAGEATCEQVEQAVAEYRRRHPDLPCNPQAVAGQMSDLLQPRSMIRRPVAFDQRYSARARAGVESQAFEELGAAIAASKERSSRGGEGLGRLLGEDAPRLAAGGHHDGDGGGVVGDGAAVEPRRLLAGD